MKHEESSSAIVALTNNGCQLGARLHSLLDGSDLFIPAHRETELAGALRFDRGVYDIVGKAFGNYDRLLLIFSTGIAVRALATCLRDKHRDPAVVVMDEMGRFAISLLSGHLGGANDFARHVAELIGAIPVITTASDVLQTLAVDLLGHDFGWEIEDHANVTRTSAAVVNGAPVGVYQDAGGAWWPIGQPLPPNIKLVDRFSDLVKSDFAAALIITDQVLDASCSDILAKSVIYRPKSLVIGIGCNRGTAAHEIESAVCQVLAEYHLSSRSVCRVASIDIKRSEDGMIGFARDRHLPIAFFGNEQLDMVEGILNPSAVARRWTGSRSVAEAAALLASGGGRLIVPKNKLGNVTVAVARILNEAQAAQIPYANDPFREIGKLSHD